MPHLNETKYQQAQVIADINAGTSFVKVIPDDIGDLVYFDTDEPKAEPLADSVYTRRKIITAIVTLTTIVGIWFWLYDHIGWGIILTLAAAFIGVLVFLGQSFSGHDFFVGTEGYAKYHFVKSRENIDSKVEHRYDEGFLLLHKEVVKRKNGSYDGTDYSYTYIGMPNEKGIAKTIDEIDDSYNSEVLFDRFNGYQEYHYWCSIEDQITSRYLYAAERMIEAGESVPFFIAIKEDEQQWKISNFIHLSPGAIHFGDNTYTKDDLKRVYIEHGVIYFEDSNYSSKMFGLKKTGEKISIPLEMIGNRKAFIFLLSKLYGIT